MYQVQSNAEAISVAPTVGIVVILPQNVRASLESSPKAYTRWSLWALSIIMWSMPVSTTGPVDLCFKRMACLK